MVNRKEYQGADALSKIKEESSDAEVDWKECDLGNLGQVKIVFTELRDTLDRLNFLVLSAGINAQPFGVDADGIDRHMGVNYLGQYYATNQLWPLIRKTSFLPGVLAPRVVALSSEVHIDWHRPKRNSRASMNPMILVWIPPYSMADQNWLSSSLQSLVWWIK